MGTKTHHAVSSKQDTFSGSHWYVVHRYLPLLSLVPYTRAFFIVGSLARKEEAAKSDIDLLVETRDDRVWLQRLLFTIALACIGKRRTKKKRATQFCINATVGQRSKYKKHLFLLHPYRVPLAVPRSSFRKGLEFLLDITLIGALLERLSRLFLTHYIQERFSAFCTSRDAVCRLSCDCIAYHPPRN